MHEYRWIENISNGELDASSIISQSLPDVQGSPWLPIGLVKEYSLIFVIDESRNRVNHTSFSSVLGAIIDNMGYLRYYLATRSEV
jgi:hypothetical protein